MNLNELYYRIIAVANHFLTSSSNFSIEVLKDYDPTVATIAKNMRTLATILKDLAGDSYEDENMALNAFQCCLVMERIADVVAEGDDGDLDLLVKQLEMHVKVP